MYIKGKMRQEDLGIVFQLDASAGRKSVKHKIFDKL